MRIRRTCHILSRENLLLHRPVFWSASVPSSRSLTPLSSYSHTTVTANSVHAYEHLKWSEALKVTHSLGKETIPFRPLPIVIDMLFHLSVMGWTTT